MIKRNLTKVPQVYEMIHYQHQHRYNPLEDDDGNVILKQIGDGQIISLVHFKWSVEKKLLRRIYFNGSYIFYSDDYVQSAGTCRKAKFNCIINDNGGQFHLSNVVYKLNFSSQFLTNEQMDQIYLGSILYDVNVIVISNLFYVCSFKKFTNPSILDNISMFVNVNSENRNLMSANNFNNQLIEKLPSEIRKLYQYCSKFDYSFVHSLAYVFADNICRCGSFFRVKMALMLSLVSQMENPKNNCSLLVICDDDLMIGRLFQWSSSLSKNHFIHFSNLHSLAGNSISFQSMTETKRRRNDSFLECGHDLEQSWDGNLVNGGTLNLAADGIHIFTSAINLNSLPMKERAHLEHALESNEIIARDLKATNSNIEQNELKAIIWANIIHPDGNNSDNNNNYYYRKFCHKQRQKKIMDNNNNNNNNRSRWTDLFAMVWTVNDAGLYLAEENESTMSMEQWRIYIDICNNINPILTAEAEYIVKSYFMMNRHFRYSNQFKSKSISIIFLMSKCIAKLNLRNIVSRSDAILAVMLHEEQLLALYPQAKTPIVFAFEDLTHISFPGEQQQNQCLTSLLDDSYMNAFDQMLMKSFSFNNNNNNNNNNLTGADN